MPTFHLPTMLLLIVRWMVETAYSLFGMIGASIKEGICVSERAQPRNVYEDRGAKRCIASRAVWILQSDAQSMIGSCEERKFFERLSEDTWPTH